MTKPTQDKETLREAVARAICGANCNDSNWRHYLDDADAAIATMFERLRTPSERMIATAGWHLPEQTDDESVTAVWQAMLAAFQQENSDATS